MAKEAIPFGERLAIISQCTLFSALNTNTHSEIARGAISQNHQVGELLFRRGESANSLLLVVDGLLRLSLLSSCGREISLFAAGRGDILGENVLLGPGRREADCLAITKAQVLRIRLNALTESIMEEISQGLNVHLYQRVSEMLGLVEDITLHNLETRLARLLCRLEQQHTSLLHFHQGLIASMAGATRPKVNRQLWRFHRSGAIELRAGKIVAIQRNLLEKIAGIAR